MTAERAVDADELAALIAKSAEGRKRLVVAIAGPPGSGKSTLSARIAAALNRGSEERAVVVPMDGFHYDNAVLEARGLLARKGAPETFDVAGFAAALDRISSGQEVALPLFDRALDLARSGAAIVTAAHRILLVEGNYLLLDEAPWNRLSGHFSLTVRLDAPMAELEQRLVQRWRDHGLEAAAARARALLNDIPNARRVIQRSRRADCVLRTNSNSRDSNPV